MKRRKRAANNKMAAVARRVGVSLSTVSRALADSPLISEETRRQVREAAESLNYRVDAAGSSLRTGLTRTVGVIIPLAHAAKQNLSDPFFLEILGALADELTACGYSMLLNKVTEDPSNWIATIARGRRADGVIVIGQSLHHESLNQVAATEFPMVVWGSTMKDQRYVTVGSDNEAGGKAATAHLVSQGCRTIVFLGDPAAPEVAARLEGYRQALTTAGIARSPPTSKSPSASEAIRPTTRQPLSSTRMWNSMDRGVLGRLCDGRNAGAGRTGPQSPRGRRARGLR